MPSLRIKPPRARAPRPPAERGPRPVAPRPANDNTPPPANDNDVEALLRYLKRGAGTGLAEAIANAAFSRNPGVAAGEALDDFLADPYGYLPFLPGNPSRDPGGIPGVPGDYRPGRRPPRNPVPRGARRAPVPDHLDPNEWDAFYRWFRLPGARPLPPTGFVRHWLRANWMSEYTSSDTGRHVWFPLSGHTNVYHGLDAQAAPATARQVGQDYTVSAGTQTVILARERATASTFRYRFDQCHVRQLSNEQGGGRLRHLWTVPRPSWPDPNPLRGQPGPRPAPPRPAPPEPAPPLEFQYDSHGRAGDRPWPGHRRGPPRRGEREAKVLSRSARLGIALYQGLDNLSEKAELVDSIYGALPADVRKRWEKGRKDRTGDQFGQYGVEGADWKLQALWHNWHKVDMVAAVKNIVANSIEDRVIGAIARNLPKQFGNAMMDADYTGWEERVAKALKGVFEAVGLQ